MVIEPLALGVVRREVDGVTGEGARREELEEEAEAEEEGLARGGAVTVAEPDEDGGASFDGFLLKAEVTSTWSLDSEARNNNTKERRSPLSFLLLLHLSMIRRVIGARFLAVLIVSLQRETKSTS